MHAVGLRLAEAVRRLHERERCRLMLFEGGVDPTQLDQADESRADAVALLDPRDDFRLILPLEPGAATRLQPWIEVMRQGLEPILDLGPSPEKGVHP